MKPTISFDMDGVCADWESKFIALAESIHPQHAPLPPPTDWDFTNWPMPQDEMNLLHMTWKSMPDFYLDLKPCENFNGRFLFELNKRVNLIFTTARHACPEGKTAQVQTEHWLTYQTGIKDPLVVVAFDKIPVLRATQAMLHIDDHYGCIRKLYATKTRGLLMRSSHNAKQIADHPHEFPIAVAATFNGAMQYINMLLESISVPTIPLD